MIEVNPFKPFIGANTKYLILGSFTATSYKTDPNHDWYYGSKRSMFWPIMEEVFNVKFTDKISK